MVKPDKMFLFLVDINSIKEGTFITFDKKKQHFKFEKIRIMIRISLKEDMIVFTFTDNFSFFVYSKWLESIRQ